LGLVLKYLDGLELDKATAAELTGEAYSQIIETKFQLNTFLVSKDKKGPLD